jgi:LmbE family N-acetylglucosaminyl deacetylase
VRAEELPKTAKLKVLVAGAHPDDPESGYGGTIARYVDHSHEVAILYLTRGVRADKGRVRKDPTGLLSGTRYEALLPRRAAAA